MKLMFQFYIDLAGGANESCECCESTVALPRSSSFPLAYGSGIHLLRLRTLQAWAGNPIISTHMGFSPTL